MIEYKKEVVSFTLNTNTNAKHETNTICVCLEAKCKSARRQRQSVFRARASQITFIHKAHLLLVSLYIYSSNDYAFRT